ncbi:hypothetical protein [Acinetobacter sp. Ver3]|uniref:hypothetical protein n=1 Tax=Acinetobacter sp. Ver3 TaxID=466088 RepID=UPI00044ECD76|nr:hypothetical protein [Acinetobacter sp. Ver3]EZQ10742.1 hypothetical protein CL42_06310 [Acinetobacter sp. Ver3]
MSFITEQQALQIIGTPFEISSDKAQTLILANAWVKNQIGFVPESIDENLTLAAAEIVRGIIDEALFVGVDRQTVSETVNANGVSVSETFAEGSVVVTRYEQIAKALIQSVDLANPNKSNGFGFEVYR